MNVIENFLNSDVIYALGWTLIHSIWQILLIGFTLKILLSLYKNHSSNLKYSLSVSAFFLISIVSVITFFSYLNVDNSIKYSGYNFISSEFSEVQVYQSDRSRFSNISGQSLMSFTGAFISSNIQYIVGIWLAGLFIFYLRLAGSYWYIQRLKTRNLFPPSDDWDIKINELAHKLQIKRIIRIAQSTTIQIPIVIGHLKPIILLPIGLMSSLPYNQVEAILLHELAHIKRNDYLVNLVKSIVEIVFFYHPVLWWVSSKIDEEREHCCDDLTIQLSSNESSLQDALLTLQKINTNSKGTLSDKPSYIAAALFRNKHQLLKRIKRMKTQNFSKQSKFNGLTATFILLISLVVLATFSAFSPTSSDLPIDYQDSEISLAGPLLDSEKPLVEDITINELNQEDGIIVFPPDSTKKREKNKDIDQDVDNDRDKDIDKDKELQKELEEAEKELERAENEINKAMKAYDKAMIDYHKQLSKTNDLEINETWTIAEKDYAKAMALAELHLKDIDIPIPDLEELRIAEILEEQMQLLEEFSVEEHMALSEDLLKESIELHELQEQLQLNELNEHLEELEEKLEVQFKEFEDVRKLEFEAQLLETKIKSELIKDRLIENEKDELSFILSAKKLEVNGKNCSAELHQKYLGLYEDITDKKLEGTTKLIFQD